MQEYREDDNLHILWNASPPDVDGRKVEEALDTFRENRNAYRLSRRRRATWQTVLKWAAFFVLPLLAAWGAWYCSAEYYSEQDEFAECYVPDGKTDSLLLSDNTKVIINAGTSIIYPAHFNKRHYNRNVYVDGNCHFSVAKDKQHPFVVNMGSLKVEVLGTHFSVNSYNEDDKITVTLEEGLVKAFDKRQSMLLHPNEQLVYYRHDGRMLKTRVDATEYNSWVNGNLSFNGQPLTEILTTLERHYNVKFEVTHGINTNKHYTMNFRKGENIDSVLKVLSLTSGSIRYKRNANAIKLY